MNFRPIFTEVDSAHAPIKGAKVAEIKREKINLSNSCVICGNCNTWTLSRFPGFSDTEVTIAA